MKPAGGVLLSVAEFRALYAAGVTVAELAAARVPVSAPMRKIAGRAWRRRLRTATAAISRELAAIRYSEKARPR
jgi:hypothetical protein